jgi:hypothetical protein
MYRENIQLVLMFAPEARGVSFEGCTTSIRFSTSHRTLVHTEVRCAIDAVEGIYVSTTAGVEGDAIVGFQR